jgi:hypothetical protein
MGTGRPTLLVRLRQALFSPRPGVMRERIDATVPTHRADDVKTSLEKLLAAKGIDAPVTTENLGDGKTRLHVKISAADAKKLDLRTDGGPDELQRAMTGMGSG